MRVDPSTIDECQCSAPLKPLMQLFGSLPIDTLSMEEGLIISAWRRDSNSSNKEFPWGKGGWWYWALRLYALYNPVKHNSWTEAALKALRTLQGCAEVPRSTANQESRPSGQRSARNRIAGRQVLLGVQAQCPRCSTWFHFECLPQPISMVEQSSWHCPPCTLLRQKEATGSNNRQETASTASGTKVSAKLRATEEEQQVARSSNSENIESE